MSEYKPPKKLIDWVDLNFQNGVVYEDGMVPIYIKSLLLESDLSSEKPLSWREIGQLCTKYKPSEEMVNLLRFCIRSKRAWEWAVTTAKEYGSGEQKAYSIPDLDRWVFHRLSKEGEFNEQFIFLYIGRGWACGMPRPYYDLDSPSMGDANDFAEGYFLLPEYRKETHIALEVAAEPFKEDTGGHIVLEEGGIVKVAITSISVDVAAQGLPESDVWKIRGELSNDLDLTRVIVEEYKEKVNSNVWAASYGNIYMMKAKLCFNDYLWIALDKIADKYGFGLDSYQVHWKMLFNLELKKLDQLNEYMSTDELNLFMAKKWKDLQERWTLEETTILNKDLKTFVKSFSQDYEHVLQRLAKYTSDPHFAVVLNGLVFMQSVFEDCSRRCCDTIIFNDCAKRHVGLVSNMLTLFSNTVCFLADIGIFKGPVIPGDAVDYLALLYGVELGTNHWRGNAEELLGVSIWDRGSIRKNSSGLDLCLATLRCPYEVIDTDTAKYKRKICIDNTHSSTWFESFRRLLSEDRSENGSLSYSCLVLGYDFCCAKKITYIVEYILSNRDKELGFKLIGSPSNGVNAIGYLVVGHRENFPCATKELEYTRHKLLVAPMPNRCVDIFMAAAINRAYPRIKVAKEFAAAWKNRWRGFSPIFSFKLEDVPFDSFGLIDYDMTEDIKLTNKSAVDCMVYFMQEKNLVSVWN